MRPVPDSLVELRATVRASIAIRRDGRIVPESKYAAMSDAEKKKCQEGPDPRLVEQLVEAEREHTASFRQRTNTCS